MWTLEQLQDKNCPRTEINEKWVPVRPINYMYRSFSQKIKEAWMVFTGKADCFIWPEGQ